MLINPIKFEQSITGYLAESLREWRNASIDRAESRNKSTLPTLILAETAYGLVALAGIVETIFRSFIFLCVGGIWLCLDERLAELWKEKYGVAACQSMLITACSTLSDFAALGDNLKEERLTRYSLFQKWFQPIESYGRILFQYSQENAWM